MSTPLTVNNNVYNYPGPGEDPGWGADASDWAAAVTDVLASVVSTTDILQTSFTIANNVSSATNITTMTFDTALVRAANISYSIYRKTDSATSGNVESGVIYLTYDNGASSGNKWLLGQQKNGESSVVFSITDAGQVQYTSSNLAGANYVGTLKFTAKTLAQ
jgi:hypothetical protein